MNQENQREQFNSKIGFILACIGSAIGMGNIWLFPWRVGKYGGAAFLIPYLLFVLIFGTTGLITEFALGRYTRKGAIGSFNKILSDQEKKVGHSFGYLPIIGVSFIGVGYAVVVGWVLKYLSMTLTGELFTIVPNDFFGQFVGSYEPIFWHAMAIFITLITLNSGVAKGIERLNKIMMPGFFILFFILMLRAITLENASVGIRYLMLPEWSYLLNLTTWVMAIGQAFFTVSLSGATMVVYGSYLDKKTDIPNSALNTAVFDTLGALMAAFVVIPTVFAFGLDASAGPPLLFISLPLVFQQMPFGSVFAILFFIAILFAALSSMVSLVEPSIEALMDKFSMTRKGACGLIGSLFFIIGIFIDLNIIDLGQWMDIASIYMLPMGALLVTILFYWVYGGNKALKEINQGAKYPLPSAFIYLAKYGLALVAIVVLVLGAIYGGIG